MSDSDSAGIASPPRQPPAVLSPQRLAIALAAVALVVATCALVHSTGLLARLLTARPPQAQGIEVDAGAFKDYFSVEKKTLGNSGRMLVVTLKRAKAFPLDDDDFDALAEKTVKGVSALLALEAVARGYVRCECFDGKSVFLDSTAARIRALAEREMIELELPIAGLRGLQRVVITY